jgi:hypothetical protein
MERHVLDFRSLNFPTKPPYISKWEKPKKNSMKINIDGAFNKDSNICGWGYIIRDTALSLWQQGRENLVISAVLCLPKL